MTVPSAAPDSPLLPEEPPRLIRANATHTPRVTQLAVIRGENVTLRAQVQQLQLRVKQLEEVLQQSEQLRYFMYCRLQLINTATHL